MKAVVYHKPRDVRVQDVPHPRIQAPRDIVLRVTAASLSGCDLHIYNGFFPQARKMVLGHEFMGIIEDVGSAVLNLKRGDRVVVASPVACGRCWFCARALPTACEVSNPKHYGPEGGRSAQKGAGRFGGGDLYGGYPGGQAEYVRVPFADFGARKVPAQLRDEQALFLGHTLPAGWAAIDWAGVQGGETVAVFGCGPVGLMAQKAAWLRGAASVIGLDVEAYRLDLAEKTARSRTILVSAPGAAVAAVREMTGGRGADVCVDAVGMSARGPKGLPSALAMALSAARRGGFLSVVGTYGLPYDDFPLGQVVEKGLGLRAGQVPAHRYLDELMKLVAERRLVADDIVTHVLPLEEAPRAYKLFNSKKDGCVKVVFKPG